MSELKPCPFCGRQPYESGGYVSCHTELCLANTDYHEPAIGPITDWNTRPIEDALNARIAELSQAVGLITTMKPTMVMDANHPLDMAKEVAEYVTARITELEAAQRWRIVADGELPEDRATVLVAFTEYPERIDILTATYYKRYEGFGGVDNYWHIEGWHSGNVTHWMPLPQSPEVKE